MQGVMLQQNIILQLLDYFYFFLHIRKYIFNKKKLKSLTYSNQSFCFELRRKQQHRTFIGAR